MDKTNAKILTLSFLIAAALAGFTLHLLIRVFSGAFGLMAQLASSDVVRHGLPVAFAVGLFALLQFHPKILAWGNEVVAEVRKVVWPSQKDVYAMTVVVIIMVIISSIIITIFDFSSGSAINLLMK